MRARGSLLKDTPSAPMIGIAPRRWSIVSWPVTICRRNWSESKRWNRVSQRSKLPNTTPMKKEHKEFHRLDLNEGWEQVPGYPPGIYHKTLAGSLDETAKRGNRTRLLRFAPGVFTTRPFLH